MVIKRWVETFLVDMAKNGCGYSDHRTIGLTVFQDWIVEIYWFFCILIQIRES